MTYNLVEETEKHLVRPRFPTNSVCHLYPTEASVKLSNGVVLGSCMRAGYYRCKGEPGIPHTARSQQIFKLGKSIENMIIDTWKEMGIYETSSVRFSNPKYNVSGELDCILKNPEDGLWFGAEVKSFYGYQQEVSIFGNKGQPGGPKTNNLLQTLVYAYEFKHKLPYFELFYIERGRGAKRSFRVEVIENADNKGVYWPRIDGKVIKDYTVNDIYSRYGELSDHIVKSILPDKEFELKFSNEKIEQLFHDGQLSKSKYEAFKKVSKKDGSVKYDEFKRPGCWECGYCSFKNLCWNDNENPDLEPTDTTTEDW